VKTPHVLVTSSTTAYGAWPDNPPEIEEDWILRGQPDFAYARDKTEADRLCQLWAERHPESTMTIVRPCIVLGPNVDNYIVRAWEAPFFPVFRGLPDAPVQFVHEDDLVEGITGLLLGGHAGAYNITGDGTMTWRETAQIAGMTERTFPYGFLYRLNSVLWRLRVPGTESPPGNLNFIRHPWVCSNRKVKEALGWQPKHTTLETFEATLRARGILTSGSVAGAAADGRVGEPAASPNGHGAQDPAGVV
jgi:UDP-glucose 4-epimerase